MPIGLPRTYATTIPIVTGELNARERNAPLTEIPVLASAKSGTKT